MTPRDRRYPADGALAATRQSLLTRLRTGNDQGWQRFFDTYAGVIHALGLRAGLSRAEADDVLQEVLLSVAREIPDFRYDPERGSFKGWLFQITRRRIADHFRQRARRQQEVAGEPLEQAGEPSADPLTALWDEEWRQTHFDLAVERVKQKVSARQWQMFSLSVLQQLPTPHVCEMLGVNRAQLYMARMRVTRLLKAEANALPADGPF